jgi:predicted ATPase/DNA-binding SARP family transcriptional activator/DNA-binding CsgD family transcriptional regulator
MYPPARSERLARSESPTGEKPEAVRVWLLGGFRASVDSRNIEGNEWRLKKAASLIKLLALAPGHHLHREQVMDLLWPDLSLSAAANNLRQVLYRARRVLEPTPPAAASRYLELQGEQLVLCPDEELWVDVETFEQAAATARRARDPAAYRAAIELYTGDLLPEDRYEEWAESRRQEVRRLYLSLLVELAGLCEERGEHKRGIEVLQRVVDEEPTVEEAHAGLMRLYTLLGREGEALAQYERLRVILSKELGAEPSTATRRLQEEIVGGRFSLSQFVGPASEEPPDPSKHNLPAPRDSFVGREREILEVKRTLAMTRLLTLTGAGGSGKTRLVLEVARDLVGAYSDGVWLVGLAPLTEGTLVPQAVAGALGVQEQPGQPLTDTLTDVLRAKQVLLVLDNCEHLVEAAAQLVDMLLDSCTRLRMMATSREALRVAGEVIWRVPPLSLPDPQRPSVAKESEGYESVRLFVERAQQRDPAFALTPDNAQAVADICRKLDGVPLALELAAARVGALAVAEIASRLGDSLGLLTHGGRTAVPRQRTLRGALDWSHDLLGEPEQILYRRLSTFAGGWTLEAVEIVGLGDGVAKSDVLGLLSGLVDKSLVVTETAGDGVLRYGMLEPVRQYAREKLENSGEAEAILHRHAKVFLALAEEAEKGCFGPRERKWLDRLESEHDNLRAALSWALDAKDSDLGLRLAAALVWFWHTRGYHSEGARRLEEALTGGGATDAAARAKALCGLGQILRVLDDLGRAEACLEEALALYEELEDRAQVAECLASLGWVTQNLGEATRATSLFEESLAIGRQVDHVRHLPFALTGLAWIAAEDGDLDRTRRLHEEALALFRELNSSVEVSGTLFMMGYLELAHGNDERATTLLEEAIAGSREVGDKGIVAFSLQGLGMAATLRGEPERAEALLKESLAIVVEQGISKADVAESLEGLAGAAVALGQHLRAARLWGAAGALREVSRPWSDTERLLHEPWLVAARSHLDEATWEEAFADGKAMGLEEAVEYALSEERTITSSQAPDQPSVHVQPPALTRREEEVAKLMAQGLTNRQIATELSISELTAATHIKRILKKLGLQSRAQIGSWLTEQQPSSSDRD